MSQEIIGAQSSLWGFPSSALRIVVFSIYLDYDQGLEPPNNNKTIFKTIKFGHQYVIPSL